MKIEQGELNPFTLQPVGIGINSAHFAMVSIGGLSERCVVKKISEEGIAAECFCALVGDSLSLPVLTPVVITDPRDQSLWFGARDQKYPNISAHLKLGSSASHAQLFAIANVLLTWSHLGHVISFDELIANGDRNPGNILWDGQTFTIIDHELALGNRAMTMNKLALFATANFAHPNGAVVSSAALGSAMAQQAFLKANDPVWSHIQLEFQRTHSDVSKHHAQCEKIVQALLPLLHHRVADAMSPLLQGARP